MHKSQKFFKFSCAFIGGIALASVFIIPSYELRITGYVISILFILLFFNKFLRIIMLIALFFLSGIFYFNYKQPIYNKTFISTYNEQKITFIGIIDDDPDERIDHTKLKIAAIGKYNGNVLVKVERFPKYSYGDKLEVTCKLREPGKIDKFDYGRYLARYNIYSTCYNPKIKVLDKDQGNVIKKYIYIFKRFFTDIVTKIIHEPQASFLAGILLGLRKGIDPDLIQAFNITGTTHIIAVSGYNITIVAGVIIGFLQSIYIRRKYSFWLACVGIIIFTILTGASAAVVRSAIMGMIVLFAVWSGRKSSMHNVLVLTCLIMLLINPKVLMYDVGFQLSFLATLGLIYFTPVLEKVLYWMPEKLSIRESLTTTLSAIVFTTPIILYNFERFSIIAPIANLLILPAIPLSMLVGFIGIVFGIISIFLGQIFSWITWITLSYIIIVIKYLAKIPYASIQVQGFGLVYFLLYFLIILALLRKRSKNS